jgi:hypothetical protein
MARLQGHRRALATSGAAIALLTAGLLGQPAYAVDFDVDGWSGTADTTLTSNGTVRTESPNLKFLGSFFGGTGTGTPTDGDLNFKQGDLVSQQNRVLEEIQLKHDETTVFVRGTAFYDPVLSTGSNADERSFDRGSIDESGHAAHLLDAFIDQKFDLAGLPSSIRVGNQVINWGESTFIQGINLAAPIDVTADHSPGTELKNVILPVTAFDFRTSLTPDINFESYYQLLNVHDRLDGEGTFFSGSNTAAAGGLYAVEGSSSHNPSQAFLNFTSLAAGPFGAAAPFGYEDQRDPDKSAKNLSNEFGTAFRWTLPELADAELGFYFENYASRTPFPQVRTGSQAAARADELGLIGFGPSTSYFATSGFSFTYPENIHLLGTSFNFSGPDGWAFQGEYSARLNQPILLAISDTFFGIDLPALCDPTTALFKVGLISGACAAAENDPVVQAEGIKPGDYNQLFQTYKRFPVSQLNFGVTKLWSDIPDTPIQTVTFVAEAGLDYVHNFPKASALLDSFSTAGFSGFSFNGVNAVSTTSGGIQSTQLASQTSYGYVMLASFDLPRTLPASIDMIPSITFTHDVQGNSPIGAGSFVAHAAAVGLSVDFSYLQNLTWGFTYSHNFNIGGSPETNLNTDLDFVSARISYSF